MIAHLKKVVSKCWFSCFSTRRLVVSQFLTDSTMCIYDGQLQHSGYISVNWWFPKLVSALYILTCRTNHCSYHNVTPFCDSAKFYDMLHCHYAITIHLHQLAMNFDGGYVFAQTKLNHTMNLAVSCSPLGCYCTFTYSMSSIYLTDTCAVCWMLNSYFTSATSYQKLKCMMNIKVTE